MAHKFMGRPEIIIREIHIDPIFLSAYDQDPVSRDQGITYPGPKEVQQQPAPYTDEGIAFGRRRGLGASETLQLLLSCQ